MADPVTTPAPGAVTPGTQTSEFKVTVVATILSILATVVPTLISIFGDLQAKFPSWTWAGPVLGMLGIIGTVLTALGYQSTRAQVKEAASAAGAQVAVAQVDAAAANLGR
jgi:hypothetical protein